MISPEEWKDSPEYDDYLLDPGLLDAAAAEVWRCVPVGHGDWNALGEEAKSMWLIISATAIAVYNTEMEKKNGTVPNADPL